MTRSSALGADPSAGLPAALVEPDYQMIAEMIPHIVWMAAPDGTMTYFNRRGTDYTGQSRDERHGWDKTGLAHPEDVEQAVGDWEFATRTGTPYELDCRIRRFDGEYRWHAFRANPLRDAHGAITMWVGTATEIESRKELEISLRHSERNTNETLAVLESVQAAAPVGFLYTDRDLRIVRINDTLARVNGAPAAEQIGRTVQEVQPATWSTVESAYRRALSGEASLSVDLSGPSAAEPGRLQHWLVSHYPLRVNGEVVGVGNLTVDITRRVEAEEALAANLAAIEYTATHDLLTGLLNRDGLREGIRTAASTAEASPGEYAAVLVLNLEGFRAVNATLGHRAGDQLLEQVARKLRHTMVAPDVSLARLNNDGFGILLSHLDDPTEAAIIAAELHDVLQGGAYSVQGVQLSVEATIGIAGMPDHGRDGDLLLQRADLAAYRAWQQGDLLAVYDDTVDRHDVSGLGLLVELRRAIENDELVLYYQPKARLDTGELTGVESLLRWNHPTRGLVPPNEFIPVAENTALMEPLTEWVLRHAIAQAAAWRDAGRSVPIAVNVSPRSLLVGDLPGTVQRLLASAALPAELLKIEITETAIMTDHDRATEVLGRLQAIGVSTAIDDFGAGYTCLGYLSTLPVQALKIDMSLVQDMLENDKSKAIVDSIISLAHKLGLSVIAEGIETPAAWGTLGRLGCDEGQGYHLSRPMPAADAVRWMAARDANSTPSTRVPSKVRHARSRHGRLAAAG